MGSSNDWIMPVFLLGAVGIGGLLFLPQIVKAIKRGDEAMDDDYVDERSYSPQYRLPIVDVGDVLDDVGSNRDSAYLISEEDFDKLDIGKKDKKWLNKRRKVQDARLERVLYADNPSLSFGLVPSSYYVNTVNPYGGTTAGEFGRLGWSEGNSRLNTDRNTINLY